jgi:hypothetical protein
MKDTSVTTLESKPSDNERLLYVEFCEELVYGTVYDTCLKSFMAKTTDVRSLETKKHAG